MHLEFEAELESSSHSLFCENIGIFFEKNFILSFSFQKKITFSLSCN
jgi:hypothetical protein